MTRKIKTFLSLALIFLVSIGTFQLLASASYIPINPPLPVGSEAYWSNLARNAWQYFEPGASVNTATGLHSAVKGWPYFTLWDLSVYIFAIIDAKQIGIITSDGTWGLDFRIEKVVSFLENMQLTSDHVPYVWYQATDGTPAFTKDPANACDYGALLVALHRIETIRPDLTSRINNIVNVRINSSSLAAGVYPNSIYDYYIGCGFAYFGYGNYPLVSSALQILDRAANLPTVDVYGVQLPKMDIGLEPLMLGMVNLDPNPQLANLAYSVYLAHEARYNVTGKLTAFSEGPTGFGEPAYVYESVVTSAGQSWHLDVDVAPVAFLKVAASFLAYFNTSYSQRLMGSLQPTLLTFDGYWDGVDESSRVVSEATDKTNAMILDAAWYALSRIPGYYYTPAQTPSPTATATSHPSPLPTATSTPINSPIPTPTPTTTPTLNPSPIPTSTPIATPSATVSPTSTPESTLAPETTPSDSPSPTETTIQAQREDNSIVNLSISGNITTSQISSLNITTNPTTQETLLSFTATGQSGTLGFSNVTIPKNLAGTVPIIYVDSQICQDQGYSQDSNNYYVWYKIHFSTHQITLRFTQPSNTPTPSPAIPELSPVLLFACTSGLLIAAIALKRRKSKL
jgi:hypothetical protein